MGLDALFFARLDYQEKDVRLANKSMEWVWRPMWESLGESTQILTHTLYHHYSAPSGFDFDTLSNDEPFIIDKSLDTYNAPDRSADLYDWINHQAEHYMSTSDMLITMGDDFRMQNAHKYFSSSDNMINYWNENMMEATNIELIYSTPSMYVDALAS
jgi:lysosomal alpha-mannosidase